MFIEHVCMAKLYLIRNSIFLSKVEIRQQLNIWWQHFQVESKLKAEWHKKATVICQLKEVILTDISRRTDLVKKSIKKTWVQHYFNYKAKMYRLVIYLNLLSLLIKIQWKKLAILIANCLLLLQTYSLNDWKLHLEFLKQWTSSC